MCDTQRRALHRLKVQQHCKKSTAMVAELAMGVGTTLGNNHFMRAGDRSEHTNDIPPTLRLLHLRRKAISGREHSLRKAAQG